MKTDEELKAIVGEMFAVCLKNPSFRDAMPYICSRGIGPKEYAIHFVRFAPLDRNDPNVKRICELALAGEFNGIFSVAMGLT